MAVQQRMYSIISIANYFWDNYNSHRLYIEESVKRWFYVYPSFIKSKTLLDTSYVSCPVVGAGDTVIRWLLSLSSGTCSLALHCPTGWPLAITYGHWAAEQGWSKLIHALNVKYPQDFKDLVLQNACKIISFYIDYMLKWHFLYTGLKRIKLMSPFLLFLTWVIENV